MSSKCPYCADNNLYKMGRCNKHICYGYSLSNEIGEQYIVLCSQAAANGIQCETCQIKEMMHIATNSNYFAGDHSSSEEY